MCVMMKVGSPSTGSDHDHFNGIMLKGTSLLQDPKCNWIARHVVQFPEQLCMTLWS